jgi:hypothetical protein
MANIAKLVLGVVYPVFCLTLGLGACVATYSDLPNRITIAFDTARVPIVSIPTPVFVVAMSVVLMFSVSICSYIAMQKKPFRLIKFQSLASHGGFFSVVSAVLMWGATVIHKGLTDWQNATGPGWWLLLVIVAGLAGAGGSKYLATVIHEKLSEDSKESKNDAISDR